METGKMRRVQFTKDGVSRILAEEELDDFCTRNITTVMVAHAFAAGIPLVADGGEYELLDTE